jgi:RNA polymerase-binding transcription factor DksA
MATATAKQKAARLARARRDKAARAARLKREQAAKAARLKRDKAARAARLKRDKAAKAARLKRERAAKAARLARERRDRERRERRERIERERREARAAKEADRRRREAEKKAQRRQAMIEKRLEASARRRRERERKKDAKRLAKEKARARAKAQAEREAARRGEFDASRRPPPPPKPPIERLPKVDGITPTKEFALDFLRAQRALLLETRAELLGQATRLEDEATDLLANQEMGDVDFGDEGGEGDTMVVERERDLTLSAAARHTVDEINAALKRLETGDYGYSAVSGLPIPRERLKAIPWATELVHERAGALGR